MSRGDVTAGVREECFGGDVLRGPLVVVCVLPCATKERDSTYVLWAEEEHH